MRHKDDRKREAIGNAAIELITTIGFADTSMSKIAKAAKVSPATIYVYFENKEDLLNQTFLMVKRETSEAVLAGFNEDLSVEAGFRLIFENGCRYVLAEPIKFAFSEQFGHSPLVNRVSREEGMGYFQTVQTLFARGKQEGVIKDIPYSIFRAVFFAPQIYLWKQHRADEVVFDETLRIQTFEFIWDAVTI
ncbi:MAG: TetR/AcrR family transcriptional regulator [Chloroflexota bacterium]